MQNTRQLTRIAISGALIALGALTYLFIARPALDGYKFAENGPIQEVIACAASNDFLTTSFVPATDSYETHAAFACKMGMYKHRGTPADVAEMNHHWQDIGYVIAISDQAERDRMMKFWLSHGADLNVQGDAGTTHLILAAEAPDLERVTWLLSLGARKDLKTAQGLTAHDKALADQAKTHDPRYGQVAQLLAPGA